MAGAATAIPAPVNVQLFGDTSHKSTLQPSESVNIHVAGSFVLPGHTIGLGCVKDLGQLLLMVLVRPLAVGEGFGWGAIAQV
jgi:hypothetical protein